MATRCTACAYQLGEGVGPRCPECGASNAFAPRPARGPERVLGAATFLAAAYAAWCASGCFIAAGHGAMQARDLIPGVYKDLGTLAVPVFLLILAPLPVTIGVAAPLLALRMPRWRKWAAAIAGVSALITAAGCVMASDAGMKLEIAIYAARVITPPIALLLLVAFARPIARYFAPPTL